jgi:hypothetical protein
MSQLWFCDPGEKCFTLTRKQIGGTIGGHLGTKEMPIEISYPFSPEFFDFSRDLRNPLSGRGRKHRFHDSPGPR